MSNYEVKCVTKPDRFSPHTHITHLGGLPGRWYFTKEEVIRLIESKSAIFYVTDPYSGKIVYVGVVKENGKAPYLRTYADGVWTDNLLSLNECPLY